MPCGAEDFAQGLQMCVEIYQHLKIILKEKNLSTAVGDEGGFAPDLSDSRDVLALLVQASEHAGYHPGKGFRTCGISSGKRCDDRYRCSCQ